MTCTTHLFLYIFLLTVLVGAAGTGINDLVQAVSNVTAFEEDEHQALSCGKRAAVSANLQDAVEWLHNADDIGRIMLESGRLDILNSLDISQNWEDELRPCNANEKTNFQVSLIRQNQANTPENFPNWVPRLVWKGAS
jgi:hypothetical protein